MDELKILARAINDLQEEVEAYRLRTDSAYRLLMGEKVVRIIPDGANAPALPIEVDITEEDVERQIRDWDDWMEGYEGLLTARVID